MISRKRLNDHRRVIRRTQWNTRQHLRQDYEFIYPAARYIMATAWKWGNEDTYVYWLNDTTFAVWTDSAIVGLIYHGSSLDGIRWNIQGRWPCRFVTQVNYYIKNDRPSILAYYNSKEKMVTARMSCREKGRWLPLDWGANWGSRSDLYNRRYGCYNVRTRIKAQTRKIIDEELNEDSF